LTIVSDLFILHDNTTPEKTTQEVAASPDKNFAVIMKDGMICKNTIK